MQLYDHSGVNNLMPRFKLLCLLLMLSFTQTLAANPAKTYFENSPAMIRQQIIAISSVSKPSVDKRISEIDVVNELSAGCAGIATYMRRPDESISIPEIRCRYKPDVNLDGESPKFKCDFTLADGTTRSLKVKYARYGSSSAPEIKPAVVGPTIARIIGFHADTYCPATIICEGCSRDPWRTQRKSSRPALPGAKSEFEHAVVEVKVPGYKVTEPRGDRSQPQGLAWHELTALPSTLPANLRYAELAKRESLMLWLNLINHTDADDHNNRLICTKLAANQTSDPATPICEQSLAYAHDYGDAFNIMDLEEYQAYRVFSGNCRGSLDGGEGVIRYANYSEEARAYLASRLAQLTRGQLIDIFALAHVSAQSGGSPVQWATAFADKVQELNAARCESITKGRSVLSSGI